MQLDDNVRFQTWEPGEKVSGDSPHEELGPFSQDCKLVGIFRDPETDAGAATVAVSLVRGVGGVDVSHFRRVKADSIIFKADLGGGRVGLSFFIPAGEVLRFEAVYSATVTIRWIFFFAAPHVSVASIKDFMSSVGAIKPMVRLPARAGASGLRTSGAFRPGDVTGQAGAAAAAATSGMTMGDLIRSS